MANEASTPRRMEPPRSLQRLHAALVDGHRRLDTASSTPSADQARIRCCQQLLDDAERAAVRHKGPLALPREYLAWDCLGQFDREMVYLISDSELGALWPSLKAEAAVKLKGHRKKAVEDLALRTGRSAPARADVAEVLRQLHSTSQNYYHKIEQLRRQMSLVGLFLLVLVLGLLLAAGLGSLLGFSQPVSDVLALGTLLGLTGGVLSLAFTIARTDVTGSIPAVRTSFEVAAVRPLIGAAMALPIIVIFESGVVAVSGIDKKWIIAMGCLLAGFSERWFLGLVEGLEQKTGDGK